jgi:putative restriction endonuclease
METTTLELIRRGALSIEDDVDFRTHVEVARLFGFDYRGHQQATIRLDEHTEIWFPKLFSNQDWINEMSPDGAEITMRPTPESGYAHRMEKRREDVITFGKESARGNYRFQGVYRFNETRSTGALWVFDRVATTITFDGNGDFGFEESTLRGEQDDAIAESFRGSREESELFSRRIAEGKYAVEGTEITTVTRGSAQKAFAGAVKKNYDWTCAVTGIRTRAFLVASHIVPWSEDPSIRLDPSNGICLSTFVDRAFDAGFLEITPSSRTRVRWENVDDDASLREALKGIDEVALTAAQHTAPDPRKLQRRIDLGY